MGEEEREMNKGEVGREKREEEKEMERWRWWEDRRRLSRPRSSSGEAN